MKDWQQKFGTAASGQQGCRIITREDRITNGTRFKTRSVCVNTYFLNVQVRLQCAFSQGASFTV